MSEETSTPIRPIRPSSFPMFDELQTKLDRMSSTTACSREKCCNTSPCVYDKPLSVDVPVGIAKAVSHIIDGVTRLRSDADREESLAMQIIREYCESRLGGELSPGKQIKYDPVARKATV